jgi:hypothetical protein
MNEYIRDVLYIGTSAPVAPTLYNLNFAASHVLIRNDSAVTFRCALTTVLTTSSCILALSSEERFWQGLPNGARVVSLLTTSSSTSGFALRLGAWD